MAYSWKCLLKECAYKPAGDDRRRNFFVEEDKSAIEVGTVARSNGDAHAASADRAGEYFYIDWSILFPKND